MEIAAVIPEVKFEKGERLYALLIYREPWSDAWTIVNAIPIEAEDALAHAVTWADFQREVSELAIEPRIVMGCCQALRVAGLTSTTNFEQINVTRALLPVARDLLRSLRSSA
jgi:hypothetical protein